MRVTVSHKKTVPEVRKALDESVDQLFRGLPIGAVELTDQQRAWSGDTLNFSFTARAGFLNVPIKGWALVESQQVTIDIDLPSFLNQFIPEAKMKTAIEGQVKGLLT